jgi:hypothetical protein
VIITIFLCAATMMTGAVVDAPATPVQAKAATASETGDQPRFSIEAWNPEPAPVPSPEGTPETAVDDVTGTVRSPVAQPTEQTSAQKPEAPRALRAGDSGPAVQELESRLKDLSYDPGKVDGVFDQYTRFAVIALQKVSDLQVDGLAGPAVQAALADPRAPRVLRPDGASSRVEVDLDEQLMVVYREGAPVLITHVSTGSNETFCTQGRCRQAETPTGSFKFLRRVSGWRTAELGRIYNPVYFTDDGVAVHGSKSVPLYPASHGCVRIPMLTADLFPKLVQSGTDIHVSG